MLSPGDSRQSQYSAATPGCRLNCRGLQRPELGSESMKTLRLLIFCRPRPSPAYLEDQVFKSSRAIEPQPSGWMAAALIRRSPSSAGRHWHSGTAARSMIELTVTVTVMIMVSVTFLTCGDRHVRVLGAACLRLAGPARRHEQPEGPAL